MASIRELQALQSQAQTSRQQAVAQQRQVEEQERQIQAQEKAVRQQVHTIKTQKRATPGTVQAHPAYTRKRREGERQFKVQVPAFLKETGKAKTELKKAKGQIGGYLSNIDKYLGEVGSAIKMQRSIDKVQDALTTKDNPNTPRDESADIWWSLTAKERKMFGQSRQVQIQQFENQLEEIKKQNPNIIKILTDYNNLKIIGIEADTGYGPQSFSIDAYNKEIAKQQNKVITQLTPSNKLSELLSPTIPTFLTNVQQTQVSKLPDVKTDFKLPYETKGTEITQAPIPYSAYIPKQSQFDTMQTQQFEIGLPQEIPISSVLYPSKKDNIATRISENIKDLAKEYENKGLSEQQKNELGKTYKQIFDVNFKNNLIAETQISNAYADAENKIKNITSIQYTSQEAVDLANSRITNIINNFDNYQKSIVDKYNTLSSENAKRIWKQSFPEEKDVGRVSKFFQKYIPEGTTYESATKRIEDRATLLRSQGLTEQQIRNDKIIIAYSKVLPNFLYWSQWLVIVRERPVTQLKKLAVIGATTAAIAGASLAAPPLAPFLIGGAAALTAPYFIKRGAEYITGGPQTRGRIFAETTMELGAATAGGRLGGLLTSRVIRTRAATKFQNLEMQKIYTKAYLSSKDIQLLKANLSTQEVELLLAKSRSSGTRTYETKIKDPVSGKFLNYKFIETGVYKVGTNSPGGGYRDVIGWATNNKGKIVQWFKSTLLENVNTVAEITTLTGKTAAFTLRPSTVRFSPFRKLTQRIFGSRAFWTVQEVATGEIIEKGVSIKLSSALVKTKGLVTEEGIPVKKMFQPIRALIQRGFLYVLKGRKFTVTQKEAELLWAELLSKNKASISQSVKIPFNNMKVIKIELYPRGREVEGIIEFSIIKTLAEYKGNKPLPTYRISVRLPTRAFLSSELNPNTLVLSNSKHLKLIEMGQILSQSEFQKLFIIFEKIKTKGFRTLDKQQTNFLKNILSKLKINFNLKNIMKFQEKLGKEPLITFENQIVEDTGQLQSAFAGRGTYERTESILTQKPDTFSPALGIQGVLSTQLSSAFATYPSRGTGIGALTGLIVGQTQIRRPVTKVMLQDRIKVLDNILSKGRITQTHKNILKQMNLLDMTQLNRMTDIQVQNFVQTQVQQLQQRLQMQQQQKLIQTQVTKEITQTTTTPGPPIASLLFSTYSQKKKQFKPKIKKKQMKIKMFERKPTVTQQTFKLKRKKKPLTAFLTGFEVQR